MWKRLLSITVLLQLLTGCLQVELRGPVSAASVSIMHLRSRVPVVQPLSTATLSAAKRAAGPDWEQFGDTEKRLRFGYVEVPADKLNDRSYYLVSASGGRDEGWTGSLLGVPTQIDGTLHAIMTGAQLKRPFTRVTVLSDALYRVLEPELPGLTDSELAARLNELSAGLVSELDGKPGITYDDVLLWSYGTGREGYTGPDVFLERLSWTIRLGWPDDVAALDSENAVLRAGWAPADAGADYADALIACTTPVLVPDVCNFAELPLIGMENQSPQVTDILSRLVTSHPWMAERFRQVLVKLPADILLLMRSLTAIVIDADTRPSFYDPVTGAIYLDAADFWLTAQERGTISEEPDYRSDFGIDLAFVDLWRYVKDNDYASPRSDPTQAAGTRALADIVPQVAALLFHELAHAADEFPVSELYRIDPSSPRLVPAPDGSGGYVLADYGYETTASRLSSQLPLAADELFGLAGVLFGGLLPTAQQSRITAQRVGELFEPDRATDLYSYFTPEEDTAMLFEEAMMAIHFGIQRDIGFTPVPAASADPLDCASYKVVWGVRGRIGAASIKSRARLVTARMIPERNYGSRISNLPPPLPMKLRLDWCQNLSLNGVTAGAAALDRVNPARWDVHRDTGRTYR